MILLTDHKKKEDQSVDASVILKWAKKNITRNREWEVSGREIG